MEQSHAQDDDESICCVDAAITKAITKAVKNTFISDDAAGLVSAFAVTSAGEGC